MAFIIDPKPQQSAIKNKVCTNCGVLFGYVRKDTFQETHTDYGGGRDIYTLVHCPACNSKEHAQIF